MKKLEIKNWDGFSGKISEIEKDASENSNAIRLFRGVTDHQHNLVPKIGRPGARKNPADGTQLSHCKDEERKMLELFKRTALPYLPYQPRNDLEWLAVAQHHGAPTRLIDWTESPLVAAYFAMEKAGTEGQPAIYVLSGTAEAPEKLVDEKPDVFSWTETYCYRPPHISPRIQVQRSVFTIHHCPSSEFNPDNLEKWVFPKGPTCFEIKRILDRVGFNRASLYPDLQGLAEHVGWCYKWGRF
ncbi:MAG: FRG domain-containing protein [Nitrospirae bacterium]|nr:FRG domain-containing protein [Nitrospirota bacterium]